MTEGQFAMWLKQICYIPTEGQNRRLTPAEIDAFLARVKARSDHTRRILGG